MGRNTLAPATWAEVRALARMFEQVPDLHGLHATKVGYVVADQVFPEVAKAFQNLRGLWRERELHQHFNFTSRPVEGVDTRPVLSVLDRRPARVDQVGGRPIFGRCRQGQGVRHSIVDERAIGKVGATLDPEDTPLGAMRYRQGDWFSPRVLRSVCVRVKLGAPRAAENNQEDRGTEGPGPHARIIAWLES